MSTSMTPKNKRLGAGLDTMIPRKKDIGKKDTGIEANSLTEIDINKIEPNASQPRKKFNEDSLQELADSIKQHGLIEPLIVQESKNGFYEIIAGERRWRASRMAGVKQVPVVIKEYSSREVVEIALIENIQREDLNPIEEANAYKRLIEEFELKQDEVAESVGKSRTAITNYLRLLKLDERVQEMLVDEKIKNGHARALISLPKEQQYDAAVKVFDENLSARETESYVKKLLKGDTDTKPKKQSLENQAEFAQLQEQMKQVIGSKVLINRKNNDKGKIEIEYYSKDELDRIVEMLMNIK